MKQNTASLLLRLTFGLTMFLSHGLPKLLNFSSQMNHFPDPLGLGNSLSLGLAIFAEVICAALITLGLFTRLATVPLVITMATAVFIFHAGDPWNKMELGLMYALGYICIFLLGPGRFSLDYVLRKKI
jgi:putative oxidoreductase